MGAIVAILGVAGDPELELGDPRVDGLRVGGPRVCGPRVGRLRGCGPTMRRRSPGQRAPKARQIISLGREPQE